MATEQATHVVTHKRLYLSVGGKLAHILPGTQLALTDEKAKKMGGRVAPLNGGETLDLTDSDDGAAELEALRARGKELGIASAHSMGAPRLTEEIDKIEKQLDDLG